MAHAVEKHLVTGLPANPEKATLDGKNKYVAFWFFLGGETVLFASLFGTSCGQGCSLSYSSSRARS